MLRKKLGMTILLGFLLILLTGCATCDDTGHSNFVVVPDLPADGSIISSLIPEFTWHDESSCTPDNFVIPLNGVGNSYDEYNLVPGNESSYTWHESLPPGNQYKWRIRVNADNGPTSPYSDYLTFYTGPVCSGEALVAPDLISPGSTWYGGWITHNNLQEFRWSYPGSCLPSFYDYEFATDAAFTNVVDSGTTPDHKMFVEKTFPNCSTIFWRVRANHGGSVGPWSDPFNFHWVRAGTDCYQTHYLSDDFAYIGVRLNMDYCDQTGFIAAWTETLNPGCMVDGTFIVGDGSMYSYSMSDYIVDLGAGPCPSTGLDQKVGGGSMKFGVITPGTYCVTISRDQTADAYGPVSLMDGIWTVPRSNQILVEETIDFGPGNHDYLATFVWDETDRTFLPYPLDFTYACKFGPEDICRTAEFAMKGELMLLLGRDTNSDYKLTQINGIPCYILLGNDAINEKLAEYEGFDWRAEDLEFFPKPYPCATPEPKKEADKETRRKTCSDYTTRVDCSAHKADGCYWSPNNSCVGP